MPKKSRSHLYRKHFTRKERFLLKAIPENDVSSEINLLRVALDRNLEAYGKSSSISLKTQVSYLSTNGAGVDMIASLLRTHAKTNNPMDKLQQEVEKALDEIRKEMNIEKGE